MSTAIKPISINPGALTSSVAKETRAASSTSSQSETTVDASGNPTKVTDSSIAETGKKKTEDPKKPQANSSPVQDKAVVDKEISKAPIHTPISGSEIAKDVWKKDTSAKPVDDSPKPTQVDSSTTTTNPSTFTGHNGVDYSKPISNDTSSVAKTYNLANVPDSTTADTSSSSTSSQSAGASPLGNLGGAGGINSGNFNSGNTTIIANNGNGGNLIESGAINTTPTQPHSDPFSGNNADLNEVNSSEQ